MHFFQYLSSKQHNQFSATWHQRSIAKWLVLHPRGCLALVIVIGTSPFSCNSAGGTTCCCVSGGTNALENNNILLRTAYCVRHTWELAYTHVQSRIAGFSKCMNRAIVMSEKHWRRAYQGDLRGWIVRCTERLAWIWVSSVYQLVVDCWQYVLY